MDGMTLISEVVSPHLMTASDLIRIFDVSMQKDMLEEMTELSCSEWIVVPKNYLMNRVFRKSMTRSFYRSPSKYPLSGYVAGVASAILLILLLGTVPFERISVWNCSKTKNVRNSEFWNCSITIALELFRNSKEKIVYWDL